MCSYDSDIPTDPRSPEKRFTDLIRAEIGVEINPQAWRIFLRHNKKLAAGFFHRIVDDTQ